MGLFVKTVQIINGMYPSITVAEQLVEKLIPPQVSSAHEGLFKFRRGKSEAEL